ncbi:hypothetical protein AAMO2058_001152700 [Amorphochlora amoebiformis]
MSTQAIGSSYCGLALNMGQRMAVKSALLKLKLQEKLKCISFWGKIIGTEKDYLIAVSVMPGKLEFLKKFYVSVDNGVSFSELREVGEDAWNKSKELKFQMFKGNLQYKYGSNPEVEEGEQEDDEEEKKEKVDERLSEEERLFCTVTSIDRDTCIVPKGAYLLTPTSRVICNPQFNGLTVSGSTDPSSYVLMRKPEEHKTNVKIKCRGYCNSEDFLDGITNATPKGVWSILGDFSGMKVTIRNLKWSGFEFHTTVGDTYYEKAYFGYGLANEDLSMML